MTLGTSTRAVGSPIGSSAQYARQPGLNVVPLSVFFLQMQGEDGEDDGNGLYGKRKRRKKRPERDREADGKVANDRVVGGDAEQASGQKRQSSASASESATMSGGTPLLAPGGTSSGNVAGYPVPLGGMLRRVSPSGAPRRKRKKRTEEDRSHWISRLLK